MGKKIVVNLPVEDLGKAAGFYEALGFKKDLGCSDSSAVSFNWSDEVVVMLFRKDVFKKFIGGKEVADTKRVSGVILGLEMESKEAVQRFVDIARANGGEAVEMVSPDAPEGEMFGYDVMDIDGNIWEPTWIRSS